MKKILISLRAILVRMTPLVVAVTIEERPVRSCSGPIQQAGGEEWSDYRSRHPPLASTSNTWKTQQSFITPQTQAVPV